MAQTTEHFGWAFDPPRQYKWVGQVVEVPFRGFDLAQRAHSIKRAAFGRRRENRDTAPPVRDLDRFASFDTSQELAGSLSDGPRFVRTASDPSFGGVLALVVPVATAP